MQEKMINNMPYLFICFSNEIVNILSKIFHSKLNLFKVRKGIILKILITKLIFKRKVSVISDTALPVTILNKYSSSMFLSNGYLVMGASIYMTEVIQYPCTCFDHSPWIFNKCGFLFGWNILFTLLLGVNL